MSSTNDIKLRPRFQMEFERSKDPLLKAFEDSKTYQTEYVVSRIDDHIFIKFPKQKQHFWSPQLHLEINTTEDNYSKLYGLFSPNPTVWTLFIFLHFVVALLFVAFAVWAYPSYSLDQTYAKQIGLMVLMVVIWFILYFIGRAGRASSKDEMGALFAFMNSTLDRT